MFLLLTYCDIVVKMFGSLKIYLHKIQHPFDSMGVVLREGNYFGEGKMMAELQIHTKQAFSWE